MELNLKGKVAVVTGGTSGIGLAIAHEFAKEGVKVATFGSSLKKVENSSKELKDAGYEAYVEQVNIRELDKVKAFAEHVEEKFGGIDYWINCAGINKDNYIDDTSEEDFDQLMDINLKAGYFGSKIAAEYMKKRGGGVIINITGTTGYLPMDKHSLYAMSKAGMSIFTQCAASEWAPFGIRVVTVSPGMTKSAMLMDTFNAHPQGARFYTHDIALQRPAEPEEIAKPIVFLCSEAAGYCTGTVVRIEGGKFCSQKPGSSWDDRLNK